MFQYSVKLIKVVDGDTLDLEVDLGFKVFKKERFRLYGVNTPEIFGVKKDSEEYQKGLAAKEFVEKWFAQPGNFFIESFDGKHLESQDKYGRWLANVCLVSSTGTHFLNDELVSLGLAERYIP